MLKQIEKLSATVERITFQNKDNGWSVLKVTNVNQKKVITVVAHQANIFPGATFEFEGEWITHPKFGEQFKAKKCTEIKPANTAALEKYIGSGLIKGVGPATAKRIVNHFGDQTLKIFEENISKLMNIPGISEKKLKVIRECWESHKSIREVMMFLQEFEISTLFAIKIFKKYGNKSIEVVKQNPYVLARDIFGIGFVSADKIALKMNIDPKGSLRTKAAIEYALSSSRDMGHCYLTQEQIQKNVFSLISLNDNDLIFKCIDQLIANNNIKLRIIDNNKCYYSPIIYFDEEFISLKIKSLLFAKKQEVNIERVNLWLEKYSQNNSLKLSNQQLDSIKGIVKNNFSILTGGPGCGKTTTTKTLVDLLKAMEKKVLLAAPTGRAAQRMSEVIKMEAKTIHRLLEWNPHENGFKINDKNPLVCDFLIIDECSMLDVHIAAAVLKAVSTSTQVLFIGDPDQLPSVGAGSILRDLLNVKSISNYVLNQVFRQAMDSSIITNAHKINKGEFPQIESPIEKIDCWEKKLDCLFIDADEATSEQLKFIKSVKNKFKNANEMKNPYLPDVLDNEKIKDLQINIPTKYLNVDIEQIIHSESETESLKYLIKNIHPYSMTNYGFSAQATVIQLIQKTLKKYYSSSEVQILSPQIRGSLGTKSLNKVIQQAINPPKENKTEIKIGEKTIRVNDRIIQTKNNYDLNVFNGDIGEVKEISNSTQECKVKYPGLTKLVTYKKEALLEISLAYAITIHKSQGSEFDCVIIPISTQHFTMLYRNLIYTALTRAKTLAIFVGSRKALFLAIKNIRTTQRQSSLTKLFQGS